MFLLRYGVSGVWLAGILRAFTTSRYWNRQSQPTPWDLVWSLQKNKQHTILVIGCLHTYICADASALNWFTFGHQIEEWTFITWGSGSHRRKDAIVDIRWLDIAATRWRSADTCTNSSYPALVRGLEMLIIPHHTHRLWYLKHLPKLVDTNDSNVWSSYYEVIWTSIK